MALTATPGDVRTLEGLIARRKDLGHLRVVRRGASLTLASGPGDDPFNHARFTRLSTSAWRLDMPTQSTRWEATPFNGPLADVFATLVDQFGWTLEDVDNPVGISDP